MNEIYNAHEIKCKLPRRNNYARSEPMGWAERNMQFSTHTHTVISTQNSVFKEGRCCGGSHLHRTMRKRASLVRESFFGEFFVRGSLARESFVRGSLVRGSFVRESFVRESFIRESFVGSCTAAA